MQKKEFAAGIKTLRLMLGGLLAGSAVFLCAAFGAALLLQRELLGPGEWGSLSRLLLTAAGLSAAVRVRLGKGNFLSCMGAAMLLLSLLLAANFLLGGSRLRPEALLADILCMLLSCAAVCAFFAKRTKRRKHKKINK